LGRRGAEIALFGLDVAISAILGPFSEICPRQTARLAGSNTFSTAFPGRDSARMIFVDEQAPSSVDRLLRAHGPYLVKDQAPGPVGIRYIHGPST
jgi:hypothetical protein